MSKEGVPAPCCGAPVAVVYVVGATEDPSTWARVLYSLKHLPECAGPMSGLSVKRLRLRGMKELVSKIWILILQIPKG